MTVYAVIGMGPNNVEIPLVILPSRPEADEFVAQFPMENGWLDDEFVDISEDYDNSPLYAKLFKDGHYYAGCGGCYQLVIREVQFGVPMVGWDLD